MLSISSYLKLTEYIAMISTNALMLLAKLFVVNADAIDPRPVVTCSIIVAVCQERIERVLIHSKLNVRGRRNINCMPSPEQKC